MRKGTSHPHRCGTCSNCSPTLCSSIPCAFWFAHGSNDPVDPSSVPVSSRSKPLFVAFSNSANNVVPAVFATGAEFVRWPSDLGLLVTSQLLDSVMKSLRTGGTVRLWIDWDIPVPIDKADFPRAIASVSFRRRSRQLLSRLRRFRNFSGFCAIWTCCSKSLILQPTHHPDFLEFQRLLPHRISINVGGEVQIVLTSHRQLVRPLRRQATRNAMAVRRQQIASRACRSTNFVSKAVVDHLVHTTMLWPRP